MGFKYIRLEEFPRQLLFIFLIVLYYIIGFHLIDQTSITSDESAYIGAAYAYTQGLGLNQEHPLFFKLINSLILSVFFPNYNLEVPSINIVSGEESIEARLAAFNLGYTLLMDNANNFYRLLLSLRLPYLIFNSFIFIWFYLYTFIFKKIPSQISLVFAVLYVFSPSFYSHNFLIAFDVAVSVYALLSILTLMVIYDTVINTDDNFLGFHFLVFTVCFFIALNAKFSNLILLPITIGTYIFIAIYLFKENKKQKLKQFSVLAVFSLIIQALLISLMYRWAFRNLPNQSLIDNLWAYIDGIKMNLSTAGGIREPFWNGQFMSMTSLGYLTKIFWFKENPGLFIIGLFLLLALIYNISYQKIVITNYINKKILPLIILGSAYPLIYFWLTKDSRFIIGYRYFYPLVLFVYLLIASLTVILKHKWQKYVLLGGLTLYVYLGIVGISQSLSYVNPLWNQEKWKLADDSTLNWGQETEHGVKYLLTQNRLPEDNNNVITYQLFGVNIGFVQYLDLLSKIENYPINIQSYYAQPRFNPETETITQLPYEYLLIDSTVKQQIHAQKENNPVATENWSFLINNQPIFSRNDIIFVYKLN
ncbi:hypothetical protein cce_0376 [Crocosphaera subtropica ATCC 51142]|uniref:Glycosyltransferase RgtA/B/C/D-like domain-containing protein n=1 Tax=Crocosphaera subtropica (strain ATCC 51142 / BH68) TaxID=43989 RepID=B1X186_CROS5|nr:hypothetical protein [Crocosphaera subtropica]ACB49727.1 hypothetical protein cce_0376 [Crocosphaera subtropica ATCC 51142]